MAIPLSSLLLSMSRGGAGRHIEVGSIYGVTTQHVSGVLPLLQDLLPVSGANNWQLLLSCVPPAPTPTPG